MASAIEVTDFVDVASKAAALGCEVPTGIAILPRNFASAEEAAEFLYEGTTPTVRTLWRQAGIVETPLEPADKAWLVREKHFVSWIAPTIFVTGAWLSQNPHLISIALGVISEYVVDFFKGLTGPGNVTLSVVVESRGRCKRVDYEGPVGGLNEIAKIVRQVASSE